MARDSIVNRHSAEEVATQLRPSIVRFHAASKGNIEAIGLLFSESVQPTPRSLIATSSLLTIWLDLRPLHSLTLCGPLHGHRE